MPAKRLRLRRADTCTRCSAELSVGTVASWDREARTVTCIPCTDGGGVPPAVNDQPPALGEGGTGQPSASLAREYERRRANRERRVRGAHPHIGGFLLAWNGEPQHQKASRHGEEGEIEVATAVAKAVEKVNGVVLHNRRVPGRRGDIDHIAIVPVASTSSTPKPSPARSRSGAAGFKPPLLFIGGRDRTTYLDGLDRQVQAVRGIIEPAGGQPVPVRGALCFTKAALPLLRPVEIRGHLLLYPKALAKLLVARGPHTADRCGELVASLLMSLRSA